MLNNIYNYIIYVTNYITIKYESFVKRCEQEENIFGLLKFFLILFMILINFCRLCQV